MASKKAQKAQKAAMQARYNPYVQRIIEDEDLRDNIVQAYESARDAYGRLSNASPATSPGFMPPVSRIAVGVDSGPIARCVRELRAHQKSDAGRECSRR